MIHYFFIIIIYQSLDEVFDERSEVNVNIPQFNRPIGAKLPQNLAKTP